MDTYLNDIVNTAYNKIINKCGVEILSKQDINNLDIQWEDLPIKLIPHNNRNNDISDTPVF